MKKTFFGGHMLGPALILLCTVIWGSAFIAQKLGADHFGPFAINAYRNLLAGVFLWSCLRLRAKHEMRCTRHELLGGLASGVVLFSAMMAQQLGIEKTTPGVSAFLTANYVLIVPLLAWLVGKVRPTSWICLGVTLALLGTYFLTLNPQLSNPDPHPSTLNSISGELWTLACAVLFAVQIMVVDRFAPGNDMLRFSMVQMFVAGFAALPFVFLPSELARTSWTSFVKGLPALVYLGVFSSGIAYTLQNLGQARTPPAFAAIIMSMESVFGALFGWLLLGDKMSPCQLFGCALVLLAVVLAQMPQRGSGCRTSLAESDSQDSVGG